MEIRVELKETPLVDVPLVEVVPVVPVVDLIQDLVLVVMDNHLQISLVQV
jgi:hypothetical protein